MHDSASYARYLEQGIPSFDSLNHIAGSDSGLQQLAGRHPKVTAIDSLRSITAFSGQDNQLPNGYNEDVLKKLEQKLAAQQQLDRLIAQRTASLKSVAASATGKNDLMSGIDKELFYAKSRIAAIEQIADEPSKAESEALEYLQGTKGFESAFKKNESTAGNAMPASGVTAEDLERMGFQTRRQVSGMLQQQFGNNLTAVQQSAGKALQQWQQEHLGTVTNTVNKAKEVKQGITEGKQTVSSLRHIEKPAFKVNPMRGKPFWQRLEKSYTIQTSRTDATRPAMLELSGMAGFRHTPSLSYGAGISGSLGLGKGWSDIHFSFEGLGVRTYMQWVGLKQWGIGAYGGYERTYKRAAFGLQEQPSEVVLLPTAHNTNNYTESAVLGLTKQYRINKKWNGAVQLLWDVWWKEKRLRPPIILRIQTIQ